MYKFLLRPKWIAFHLLVIAMVVVMINLALWQVNRLSQRNDFNDQVRTNQSAEIRPLGDVLTTESVAIEIARSAVGGIALALSVPLTTAVAAVLATPNAAGVAPTDTGRSPT